MTQLNCSVTSCLYNQDHYCSKDDITVGGSNAKRTSDTCCESFRERNGSVSISHPPSLILWFSFIIEPFQ